MPPGQPCDQRQVGTSNGETSPTRQKDRRGRSSGLPGTFASSRPIGGAGRRERVDRGTERGHRRPQKGSKVAARRGKARGAALRRRAKMITRAAETRGSRFKPTQARGKSTEHARLFDLALVAFGLSGSLVGTPSETWVCTTVINVADAASRKRYKR